MDSSSDDLSTHPKRRKISDGEQDHASRGANVSRPPIDKERPNLRFDVGIATHHPPQVTRKASSHNNAHDLLAEYGTNLSHLILDGFTFSAMNLAGFNFYNSALPNCKFSNCDLSYADFRNADLYRVDFSGSILYVTQFENANLTRTDFRNARLYGVKLHGADLTRALFDPILYEEAHADSVEEFSKAAEIYYKLKLFHRANGMHEEAARFCYRERTCRRHMLKRTAPTKWLLDYLFGHLLSGYGERLQNVVAWGIVAATIFAVLYLLVPTLSPTSHVTVHSQILQLSQGAAVLEAIKHSYFFSLGTLLSAAPSGYETTGLARVLYILETIVGLVLVGIGIATYLRKVLRE